MELFDRAKELGIQAEFIDGQGHRHVTDAAALKIILDALPAGLPRRLLGGPVVIRAGQPSRTALGEAARFPVRWKIIASPKVTAREVIAEGEALDSMIVWPADLPVGTYRLQLVDAASVTEEVPADCGPAAGLWRRFRPLLAVGGAALQRPVGAQLGYRRFYRSRSRDRACGRSGGRRGRAEPAARLVRRSPRRLQPLFAEQPAVSQSALYRCREIARSVPGAECRRGIEARRYRRLRHRRQTEMAGAAFRIREVQGRCGGRRSTGFRRISRRARTGAGAVCLLRGAAAQIPKTMVGMGRTLATAR